MILAIDPGPTHSAYTLIDHDCRPLDFGKLPNDDLRLLLDGSFAWQAEHIAIEMVASYGMPVGAEVFDTCVWIGRYLEATGGTAQLVKRGPIKLHHCNSARANDANITRALVDRFAPGEPNRGKGTKHAPGWFHGFAADMWQAYALAIYIADTAP
jgi:hypothetical protein